MLRYLFVLLLIAGITGSSVGIAVFKHICYSANKTTVSLYKAKNCCKDEPPVGFSNGCCETSMSFAKDHTSKRVQEIFKIQVPALAPVENRTPVDLFTGLPTAETSLSQDRPPPLSGRATSLLHCTSRC